MNNPKFNYYIDVVYPAEFEIRRRQILQNGLIIFDLCIELVLNIFYFKRNRITNKHKAYEWLSSIEFDEDDRLYTSL